MEQEAREREKEKELAKLTGIANNNESSKWMFFNGTKKIKYKLLS